MHYRVIRKYIGSFYYKEEMEFGDKHPDDACVTNSEILDNNH